MNQNEIEWRRVIRSAVHELDKESEAIKAMMSPRWNKVPRPNSIMNGASGAERLARSKRLNYGCIADCVPRIVHAVRMLAQAADEMQKTLETRNDCRLPDQSRLPGPL